MGRLPVERPKNRERIAGWFGQPGMRGSGTGIMRMRSSQRNFLAGAWLNAILQSRRLR